MAKSNFALLLLLSGLVLAAAAAAAAADGDASPENGENGDSCDPDCMQYEKDLKAFCTSPGFKDMKCDWATQEEQEKTLSDSNPFSGTVWKAEPTQFPSVIQAHHNYYQYLGRIISLACHGPVEIKVRFKVLSKTCKSVEEDTRLNSDCTTNNCARLIDPRDEYGSILRCEVDSPGVCTTCSACPDPFNVSSSDNMKECPQEVGTWYTDSIKLAVPDGCKSTNYTRKVPMVLGVATKIELAAFEIYEVKS